MIKCFVAVVQLLSHSWVFATPWTALQQASLSFTISWSLLKLMSIELVMLSINLILCVSLHLLPLIFPSIRVPYSELAPHIRWPKYWSFSFSISPSNEYSGLIPFRINGFDLLAVQGTLKSLLRTIVQKHQLFSAQPFLWSSSHIRTWLLEKPSVQFSSVVQLCLTLCNPMDHSMPGFPVLHYLLEFAQTHVHWVSDAIQQSHLII